MRRQSQALLGLALALATLAPVGTARAAEVEQRALALINVERAKAGCGPLVMEPRLTAAAQGHADAMARQNFFAHNGKDGSRFAQRIKAQGYTFRAAAENIAAGQKSAEAVVTSWMASRSHRHNILDCRMTETGIGLAYQPDDQPFGGRKTGLKYYWVQDFGKP